MKLPTPSNLSKENLVECLEDIQEILWPDGNSDHEWDSETIELIARALRNRKLSPK